MRAADYAIAKNIENRPLVREVDETRQRQLWRWIAVAVGLVVMAVLTAWQHVEVIRYGYRLEELRQERAAEEGITRRLRLEIEKLRAPRRIEELAVGRLRMVAPQPDAVIVIERVVPAQPPPSSIVASR
jgi:cell division protein FtsL